MRLVRFVCLFVILGTAMSVSQSNTAKLINQPVSSKVSSGLPKSDGKAQGKLVESYGKLPLSFEANQGQIGSQVKFLSRATGYTLFLTGDGAVFSVRGSRADSNALPAGPQSKPRAVPTANAVLRMKFRNANQSAKVTGVDELPGKSNYFIGNDPKKWHSNVPTYGKVKYEGVYSGIDLLYYGNQQQLEYDFLVSPGADPHRIQFDVGGARNITTEKDGDLVFHSRDGELRWRKPVVYQETNGIRQTIDSHYLVQHGHRIKVAVGNYDSHRALIIDPAITYSTYLGGATNFGDAAAVAVDTSGNAYVTGYTRASDFPVTAGAFQTTCPSGEDCSTWGAAFVTKFNSTGTALVYSTYLGGNEGAQGSAIAVDSAGNAYVTGGTYSSNFPTTTGAFQTTCSNCGYYEGLGDAFVTELNPTGSGLVYSTYLGGDTANQYFNNSLGGDIAIDISGDVYVAGYTNFSGFPVTRHAFQRKCGSCQGSPELDNAFVTKFNPMLSKLVYSTFLGGGNSDSASSMALDAAGNVYLTGTATSTNFPVTKGAFQTTCSSLCFDVFVTELNASGSALVYSTYLGGSISQGSGQWGSGIAVDASGDAYVTGETGSPDFPITPGAFQTTCYACHSGGGTAFVTEFNSVGSALVYSTYLGGSELDVANGIALDTAGDAYLSGETLSADFPTTPGAFNTCSGCSGNVYRGFVSEINPTGSTLVYSTYLAGSSGFTSAWGIAMDSAASAYVIGETSSTDFPVTPGAFQSQCAGGCSYSNAFVTKFVQGDQVWPLSLNFGSEPTGVTSSPQTTVLTNSAPTTLDITSIAITGADSGDFAEKNNCGTYLPAGGSCNITVTFTPTDLGSRNADVSVTDNAPNSPQTVPLTGIGTPPIVTLMPSSLNFGSQPIDTTSPPQIVQLSTTGKLSITSIATSAEFGQTNNCPTALPAGGSCQISVTFTPKKLGLQNGTLTITDSGSGSPQTASLSGTGTQPAVTLSPASLNFGNQTVGVTSAPQVSTLTNTGNGTLTIKSIQVGGTNSGDFAQSNNCPRHVAPNGSCQISVTFTPTTTGTRKAAVTITDNAPDSPQSVPLSGVGVLPAVTFSPTSLTFSTQLVYTSSPAQKVTLTNTGKGILLVSSIAVKHPFLQTNDCGKQVDPGAHCTISVKFHPTSKGDQQGAITVADNASNSPQEVPLTGTGTFVKLFPTMVNFGTQPVGTRSLPRRIRLTNKGDSAVNIQSISVTGSDAGDFAEKNNCGTQVASGGSCVIEVTFKPLMKGKRTADVSVEDDGGGSPQQVGLSGRGT
jgi:Abnormal spindle-like microcephaly-assoc'd, ASPM-SPD-2-Hydin/Beta-propeller repeat/Protein of unknown function (DUF1573)